MVTVFGTLMRRDRRPAWFTSIPKGIYWAVVTLTTVGLAISLRKPRRVRRSQPSVMTGYSIIAVPTGVFTAELANAMRGGDQLSHDCPSGGRLPTSRRVPAAAAATSYTSTH